MTSRSDFDVRPERMIAGKSMRDHLRFASCYWHTMRNPLADPFGVGTSQTPWDDGSQSVENACRRVGVFFEFLEKIDIDFFCFHDRDIAPEGRGCRRERTESRSGGRDHRSRDEDQWPQASVGHGMSLHPSAVRLRRRDQPAGRRLSAMQRRRSRPLWKPLIGWAARAMCSGVDAKATARSSTPT